MNDYNPGGGGCLSVPGLILAALLLVFLLAVAGGDDTSTNNAEVLSRNQVNILSDVTNEYYNCLAAGSCVTSVSTSTQTSTTNAPVSVEGDRNNVAGGLRLCVDSQGYGYSTANACMEGYTEAQP